MKNIQRWRACAAALTVALLAASAAAAAPLWIERQFIPDAELVDPAFDNDGGADVVDHGAWSKLLGEYARAGDDGVNRVDYQGVADRAADALQTYIELLEATDTTALSKDEQLAFWINLYNAATVRLIVENLPTDSIRDIKDPWGRPVATVNGVALSLNDIEHGIIRPVFRDDRIHYAVNCASIGCPNLALTAWTGADIDARLDAAARDYINHPRGVAIERGKVVVSKIYGWYREDFGDSEADILAHIRQYADPDLLDKLQGADKISDYRYDWSLNAASPEAP